jgi:hypothetical protein
MIPHTITTVMVYTEEFYLRDEVSGISIVQTYANPINEKSLPVQGP